MKAFVGLVLVFIAVATSGVRAQEETTFDHDAFAEILVRYDANNDSLIDEEEFHEWFEEVLPELAEHEHEHEHEHEEGEEDEEAERRSTSKRVITVHNFTAEPCPLDEELFEIYDQDASGSLNRTEAQEMSQQLMLMLLSGCNEHTDEASQSKKCGQGETYEYWLAGLASTSLVCLLSLVGLVLLPCMGRGQSGWQALITMALLAFAAGALFGDAIFHILPTIFGAHSHDHGSEGHDHNHEEEKKEEEEDDKRYLGLAAMVFIGALLFFTVEKLLLFIVGEAHSHGGSHTHGDEGAEMNDLNDEESTTSDNDKFRFKQLVDKLHDKVHGSVETIKDAGDGSFVKGTAIQAGREMTAAVRRLRFAKSYGWLNLVADAFHNFIDGIAIGASYSQSLSLGISTTIAVICHEIPQELGDYALIVKAGFGRIFALLFNFFSASLAFLGCLIGLGVGEVAKDGDDWILAFTAGGFLYIALSNMVPELHSYVRKQHWMGIIYILIQLAGFILGAGILLLIAAFEEDIDFC